MFNTYIYNYNGKNITVITGKYENFPFGGNLAIESFKDKYNNCPNNPDDFDCWDFFESYEYKNMWGYTEGNQIEDYQRSFFEDSTETYYLCSFF